MKVEKGDTIVCQGEKVKVEIVYSQYLDENYISCEFEDSNGNYRVWKQRYDGGKLIKKSK